jgi:predicted ester cyclase
MERSRRAERRGCRRLRRRIPRRRTAYRARRNRAAPSAVVLDSLRDLHAAFDRFRLDALLLIESANYVIARWRTTGVHTGTYLGIEPTGRAIDSETCEIYEFHDGQVTRSWSYGDPGAMFTQLGQTDAE